MSIAGIDILHVLVEPSVEDGKILAGPDADSLKVSVVAPGSKENIALLMPDLTTLLAGLKHDTGTLLPIAIKECTEVADPAIHPKVGLMPAA